MCFTKSKVQLKTAEEDIKVFKIVRRLNNGNYFSFYQDFEYSKGEVYHETVEINEKGETYHETAEINEKEISESVDHAFHSYMPDMVDIVMTHCCFVKSKYVQIVPKNHTLLLEFLDYFFIDNNSPIVYVECIIPKGSMYDFNDYGEVISDSIIISKELNINDLIKK